MSRSSKHLLVSFFASFFVAFAGAANADFVSGCSSFFGASFDLIAVQVNPAGVHLANPAFTLSDDSGNFPQRCPPPIGTGTTSVSGWAEVYNDGIIAIAEGPSLDPVTALINLLGVFDVNHPENTPFAYVFVGLGGSNTHAQIGVKNGGSILEFPSWNATPPSRAELDALVASAAVPEPATLALLSLGLAGLGH